MEVSIGKRLASVFALAADRTDMPGLPPNGLSRLPSRELPEHPFDVLKRKSIQLDHFCIFSETGRQDAPSVVLGAHLHDQPTLVYAIEAAPLSVGDVVRSHRYQSMNGAQTRLVLGGMSNFNKESGHLCTAPNWSALRLGTCTNCTAAR